MARHEIIDLLMEEIERYGLKGEVNDRSKHLEFSWEGPHGRRFIIVAKTPGDHRASLNSRADLRRMLKADGLSIVKPSQTALFAKAMSLPKAPYFTPDDRFKIMSNDVETLTDLVVFQQDVIASLQRSILALENKFSTMKVTTQVSFTEQVVAAEAAQPVEQVIIRNYGDQDWTPRKGSNQRAVLDTLTTQWCSAVEISGLVDVGLKQVNTILSKLKKAGYAENSLVSRGYWRLK